MSVTKKINVDDLTKAAKHYQPQLETLPYAMLEDFAREMGINIIRVEKTDVRTEFHRKGGISRPYVSLSDPSSKYADELGTGKERELTVEKSFLGLVEDITNYQDKEIVINAKASKTDNQGKKHPLEFLILESAVRTVAEDIQMAVFPGERDTTNNSPLGMFNGIDTLIDLDVSAGEISAAKGNLINLGDNPFAAPVDGDDTTAYDKLILFVRSLNPFLRKNAVIYMPNNVRFNCMDALGNKLKYKTLLEFDQFVTHLRGAAQAPRLEIVSHEAQGTGDRIMAMIRGNIDMGMNTLGDHQFVQVRQPFANPNHVQYWIQWDCGMRINSVHAKAFATSNGTPVPDTTLSGDYTSQS